MKNLHGGTELEVGRDTYMLDLFFHRKNFRPTPVTLDFIRWISVLSKKQDKDFLRVDQLKLISCLKFN